MDKLAFVKKAEKDMDFEADCVISDIRYYGEKNSVECDFLFETFIKALREKIKAESEGEECHAN